MWIGAMLVSIRELTLGLPPNSLKKQAIQINILEIITLVFGNRRKGCSFHKQNIFMTKSSILNKIMPLDSRSSKNANTGPSFKDNVWTM